MDNQELQKLNDDIKANGTVDREHLLAFLALVPTNDASEIIKEVRNWLTTLHEDPSFATVNFPQGDIDAVIGDLDSYGRVQPLTIQQFKQDSNKAIPQVS